MVELLPPIFTQETIYMLGSSPVDGIYLPNILALWRRKTCIEKNPEFETRKQERLSSIFHWIFLHQKLMKLLV